MKRNILLLLLMAGSLFTPSQAKAADRDVSEMTNKERIFVGGFVGVQLGTFTAINLHLHVGYLITNRFSAGIGGNYQYANDRFLGQSHSSHVVGGSVFARFRVVDHFFLHSEVERLRLQSRAGLIAPEDRPTITENNVLVGVGYGLPLSDRVRVNLLLLYNLNEKSQVYFDNPFFKVGVDIYLN